MKERVLPYLWYPLVLISAIAVFSWLLGRDIPVPLMAYIPIAIAALVIIALELLLPERLDWRPKVSDIKADAAFLVTIQVIVPRILAAGSILLISAWAHANLPSSWWPHSWPLAAQIIAIVLIVDFTRYWLHRACHTYTPLWRLHEVHHSPDILYTLNVARFHPLEKCLHYALDTLPFLLLGVDPRALAGYFLLYAVNGFFQHSNIRLRYGWLNYIVGSAETHRWHHARDPMKAYCNFGNTTIIWDLVFGTWHLPGPVEDIGIPNRNYPKGFKQQMLKPFQRNRAQPTLKSRLNNLAMQAYLRLSGWISARRIRSAAKNPMHIQHALLRRILQTNRHTRFGQIYGFADVHGYADYARQVPVCDFEILRPYVETEIQTGQSGLTLQPPLRYVRTSGTTGLAKDIPITAWHMALLRRIHRMAVARQYLNCPKAFDGAILAIVSPADEGMLANGKPVGSASGIIAGSTPSTVQDKFVLPREILSIESSRLKYLTILRLALSRSDITYIGTANPTTLITLMQLYRSHEEQLINDVRTGTFFLAGELPEAVRTMVSKMLYPRPARAKQLEALKHSVTGRRIADLWPSLRMVVTWTCASAGIALDTLRRELPPAIRIMELGYLSSEFRGTFTLGRHAGSGFPTLDTHFFEFVERQEWEFRESNEPEYLTLDRLQKGREYYILVTTPSGLYRYFINDMVRVRGLLYKTPLLQFVQKGKGVTNLTGEKLYESQVLSAARNVLEQAGCTAAFIMALADESSFGYRMYIEVDKEDLPAAATLAQQIDARLQQLNIEYQSKRESGRLLPVKLFWLRNGTYENFKADCVARGQREGQFKVMALAYRKDFAFDLDAHILDPDHDYYFNPGPAAFDTV